MGEESAIGNGHVRLVFTYGTLKKGFSNHTLLQDMISTGDASYIGLFTTVSRLPLVCGPYRVPFLLNFPGLGERVTGELYSVSVSGLIRMDELEGTSKGHYERLPIHVRSRDDDDVHSVVEAEAYYGHKSYAEDLWKKNRETGFKEYTAVEAKGYVRRKERQPPNFSTLDHMRLFLSSPSY